jgi:hypothetical protein
VLQQEAQDGEAADARSSHERGVTEAGWQVDARASLQQLPHHLQVVVGCGGMQQAYGCGPAVCSSNRAERVNPHPLAQPLDHRPQLASLSRLEDLEGQRGSRAHCGLASVRWGGRHGGGRLRRRCVPPDELCDGGVALGLSLQGCGGFAALGLAVLQGGAAVSVRVGQIRAGRG